MASISSQRMVGRALMAFTMFVVAISRISQADEASPLTITADESPTLILNQTAVVSPAQPHVWHFVGTDEFFAIRDQSALSLPIVVEAFAPDNVIYAAGSGRVGFGTASPLSSLHAVSGDRPALTLEQDESMGHAAQSYEIRVNDLGLEIIEQTLGGGTPVSIESGAFTDSLEIRANGIIGLNGSVGIGTVQPQVIGSASPAGDARYFNLRSTNGTARAILQGGAASELYFVHTNGLNSRKVVRQMVANGKYTISCLTDNLANIEHPFCVNLTTTNVGIKTPNPTKPLQVGDAGANDGNGAHVTQGGVWTNASSRSVKQNIHSITSELAREVVRKLEPVEYRYKNEPDEQYVGFIAEDVPDLVATNDRKSLAPMDVVAVLTKFVQDQDRMHVEELTEQTRINSELNESNSRQRELIVMLTKRVSELEQKVAKLNP